MVTDAKTHHEAAGQTREEHNLFRVAVEQFSEIDGLAEAGQSRAAISRRRSLPSAVQVIQR